MSSAISSGVGIRWCWYPPIEMMVAGRKSITTTLVSWPSSLYRTMVGNRASATGAMSRSQPRSRADHRSRNQPRPGFSHFPVRPSAWQITAHAISPAPDSLNSQYGPPHGRSPSPARNQPRPGFSQFPVRPSAWQITAHAISLAPDSLNSTFLCPARATGYGSFVARGIHGCLTGEVFSSALLWDYRQPSQSKNSAPANAPGMPARFSTCKNSNPAASA